jgi:hypothetical protein
MKKVFSTLLIFCAFSCGKTFAQSKEQDTMLMVTLRNTDITSTRIMSDSMRWRYNQLKNNVIKILPYLNKVTKMYTDATARYGGPGENVKEKRRYMNTQEDFLRDEYKTKLKELTVTQGSLLVRLISRQTGISTYDLLKEYENGFTALKWQTISKFYDYDLRKMYDPTENRNLEHIMNELGYPLPAVFSQD